MAKMSEESYMKRYVGRVDPRRTKAYQDKGIDMKKYDIVSSPYMGLFKIVRKQPHRDIIGYLKSGNIHAAKTSADKARTSKKQSWEF